MGNVMTKLLTPCLLTVALFAETTIIDCGSASDSNFTGGLTFTVPVPGDSTGRYDALQTGFSYRIQVVDKQAYLVTLGFIEPSVQAAGQRIFSVSINNQPVIVNLDLFADVGFQKPTSRSFVAVGSAGALVIAFTTQKRSAVISSIEVKPLAGDSTPVILPTSTSVLRGCAAMKIDATTIQITECAFGVRLIFGPE